MTKLIRTLTSIIAIHALGWGLTQAAAICVLHLFEPMPLTGLVRLYFSGPLWIIGTAFYAVWLQWFWWGVWRELRRPPRRPAPQPPRATLASMYGPRPLNPGEREMTYTRTTVETWTVREHARGQAMTHPRAWNEPVDGPLRAIGERQRR
jgi:hypothetical protein